MPVKKTATTTETTAESKAAAAKAATTKKVATALAAKKATAAATKSKGSAVRKIAPAIPLAIAIAHSALAPKTVVAPTTAPTTISSTTTSTTQVLGPAVPGAAPVPLLASGHPVDWFFVFKLNAAKFPGCGGGTQTCPFGGQVGGTGTAYKTFSQQYVYASSETPTLQNGVKDCLGDSTSDPVGASFDEVYNGSFHFVIWNDQPYGDPAIKGCSGDGCSAPWGHSKGLVAWNDAGEGFVMQVSTPSWPGSGSAKYPRKTDGNTLGCVKDNDVQVSQHFFALKLTEPDLVMVLKGLANASVVTDPTNPQMVNNGGPKDVVALVSSLGQLSKSEALVTGQLSSGVTFIAKPSDMNVPPWQMVSATLGGIGLRTATWWASPTIPSTTATSTITCWDESLGKPGPVDVATTGSWSGTVFGLEGGLGTNFNHAKIGVSTTGTTPYAIFGDENQQGTLGGPSAKCSSSQNGRGGTFYAVSNPQLAASITQLIAGASAPAQ